MESLQLLFRVIITDNTLVGLILVALLAGMTTVAAAMARSHYRRYTGPETSYLNQVKSRLRSMQSPAEAGAGTASAPEAAAAAASTSSSDKAASPPPPPPPPLVQTPGPDRTTAAPPPSNLVSAEELGSSVPPSSIIGDRLRVIALLRKSQTKVNLAALQQISRAREASRTSLRFPGLAVNLAMMVGLLGTFIGIAIVIQQIGLNINSGDGSLESFGKAFGGMYTKFSTTLVGLACAIVLACLNFRLAQAQERLFEDLDRFTVAELLPATVPVLEDETLLERVSRQLEESFTLIQEVAGENAKTAQEVGAIQAGFVDIVSNIRQQTRTESADRLQNLLGQVSGVMEQVGRVNESLKNLTVALPAALMESNRNLERFLAPLAANARWPEPRAPEGRSWRNGYVIAIGAAVLCALIAILVKLG